MDSIQEKWQGSKLYQEQASSPAICPWNAHAQILSTSRDSQRTLAKASPRKIPR